MFSWFFFRISKYVLTVMTNTNKNLTLIILRWHHEPERWHMEITTRFGNTYTDTVRFILNIWTQIANIPTLSLFKNIQNFEFLCKTFESVKYIILNVPFKMLQSGYIFDVSKFLDNPQILVPLQFCIFLVLSRKVRRLYHSDREQKYFRYSMFIRAC